MEELLALLDLVHPHLKELRRRLIWCAAVFVAALAGGMCAAGPVLDFLRTFGPARGILLHAFSPWDSIQVYLQIAALLALAVSGPFFAFQLWLFASPGLHPSERRAALCYIPLSAFLLVAGMLFGYFVVFQMAFQFTAGVSDSIQVKMLYGIQAYVSFLINIITPMGLLFQMPVAVMFLTRLGILTPRRMARARRIAYFLLVVAGVAVTPPDFISDFLLIVPLLCLYEASLCCCRLTHRRMAGRQSTASD